MAGFTFKIHVVELLKSTKIEFIIISNDGTYQYKPISFNIDFDEIK